MFLFPPGRACTACAAESLTGRDLRGQGTVWSWVVFHRPYFAGMPPSYTVVRVRLAEGPLLLMNLRGPAERLCIDAPVEVIFEATEV